MEEVDVLFKNATCITMVDSKPFCRGQVAVKDGKIYAVGESLKFDAKDSFEEDLILMPGLVDAHTHAFQVLLRGFVNSKSLTVHPFWLKVLIPFEMSLSEEEARVSAELSVLNMLKKGTVLYLDAGGPYPEILAEVSEKAGIKARVTQSTLDKVKGYERGVEDSLKLIEKYRAGRVKAWLSIRQIMLASDELMNGIFRLSKEKGVPVTMHISEEVSEVEFSLEKWNLRPVELLNTLGYLGENLVLAHAAFLSEDEVDLIAKTKTNVAHCPSVNYPYMNFPKVASLLRKGANVALGSDGGAFTSLDMLSEAKVAFSALNGFYGSPYRSIEVSAYDLLKMLTVNGYKALKEEGSGKISVGYNADIIALKPGPSLLPLGDPTTIVFYATGGDVKHVIVDGKILVRDGRALTLDEEKITEEAQSLRDKVEEKLWKLKLQSA